MKILFINLDILFMFISGILLMNYFSITWSYFRVIEFLHIFGSIILTIMFVLPFLYRHIYESMILMKHKSKSGVAFAVVFVLLLVSGTYLFLVGNRGGDMYGILSYSLHLYGSFVLLLLLALHLKKFFVLRYLNSGAFLILLFFPNYVYSSSEKLTNIVFSDGAKRHHSIDWTNSVTCKACHPEIFKQWADSNHRHLADSNPYYMVLENLAEMDRGKEFRKWCMGCHNPSAVSMEQERTTHFMQDNSMPEPLFTKGSQNLINEFKKHPNRLEQGVSCIACHRITEAKPGGNSSYTLNLTKRKKYLYEDAHTDMKVWISQKLINAKPQVHKQEYMKPLYKKSEYCASCHNEFLPHSGKKVVSTYEQWKKSPYNNPKKPKEHKECIDCHMTYLSEGKFSPLHGKSTLGGSNKKDIKVHYFAGGNHFLAGLKNKENESQSLQLLKTSAKLDVQLDKGLLYVGVKNVGAGHKLPTGAADFRELWLDVTVKDRDGKTVLSSGKLNKEGEIEKGSVIFNKVFGDKEGNPVGLFFWRYEKLLKDTRIPAGKRVVEKFSLQKELHYPLHVKIKLNFRIYPQWVTNVVKAAYPQLPDPPVITIKEIEKQFD
ncbi:cytochrome c family protein [Sulfurimonas sp. SWIR-19]|uniref:cytochrome c family protein n=1 Tax=Sulfurimonas sp. SWIR-19 TaxID=2878390 RepID=UPI001CF1B432|nr:cytochrome c family protein [Sulfurimonas sp. SWIR-19]UCM99560.1 cytochrome c family protein [Sulfurimonas sp. SWIR-19]